MSRTRLFVLYGLFLIAFTVVLGRVYLTAENQSYARSAQEQTTVTLELPRERGNIYDRENRLLTGYTLDYYALCVPGESSYDRLFTLADYSSQNILYQMRNSASPFLIPVSQDLTTQGIYTYAVPRRYLPVPAATHLLGYLDGEGHGVTGIEQAMEDILWREGETPVVECVTTGTGALLEEEKPQVLSNQEGNEGVRLTLDLAIQRECEAAADLYMERGAILVLDVDTAQVLASVSRPDYDPENVAKSIQAQDTSLINRVTSQFSVGSVFKPVVAATALSLGLGDFTWDCQGWVEVNGQVYRCAQGRAHGLIGMQEALEKSCNCYFIELGLTLGGNAMLEMAKEMGFGTSWSQAGGMNFGKGNLPTAQALESVGELASFSFGQGQLLATPLQVAAMMNTIAAGGIYRDPTFLIDRVNQDTVATVEEYPRPEERRVVSQTLAENLSQMLAGVVENGLGKEAAPLEGKAAGKTGTAQTGRLDEAGEEYMDYWFVGFYPAEDPQYTILVLQDEAVEVSTSCAKIFSVVCNGLYYGKTVDSAES